MAKMQYQGTGRRKSSVARVRLVPGTGKITVNKKDLDEYFGAGMEIVKREVKRPFGIAGCEGKFDVIATVRGGGFTGQAGALRHGISRALCQADKGCRIPYQRPENEGKKEIRLKESKKSFPVLQALSFSLCTTVYCKVKDPPRSRMWMRGFCN